MRYKVKNNTQQMPKSNLYTRTGDSGTTSLVGGTRVKKNCARLNAYGTIDEFSAHLGVVLSAPECPEEIRSYLQDMQSMLFNLGGYLACESPLLPSPATSSTSEEKPLSPTSADSVENSSPSDSEERQRAEDWEKKYGVKSWGVTEETLEKLERMIDKLDAETPKVNAFVLPGGTPISAQTHVARTVCRRAERCILELADEAYVDPLAIRYVNRLSDYLFILARYFNNLFSVPELTWHKS